MVRFRAREGSIPPTSNRIRPCAHALAAPPFFSRHGIGFDAAKLRWHRTFGKEAPFSLVRGGAPEADLPFQSSLVFVRAGTTAPYAIGALRHRRLTPSSYSITIVEATGGVDHVTQYMVIDILRDEQGHSHLFEGFLREYQTKGRAGAAEATARGEFRSSRPSLVPGQRSGRHRR